MIENSSSRVKYLLHRILKEYIQNISSVLAPFFKESLSRDSAMLKVV